MIDWSVLLSTALGGAIAIIGGIVSPVVAESIQQKHKQRELKQVNRRNLIGLIGDYIEVGLKLAVVDPVSIQQHTGIPFDNIHHVLSREYFVKKYKMYSSACTDAPEYVDRIEKIDKNIQLTIDLAKKIFEIEQGDKDREQELDSLHQQLNEASTEATHLGYEICYLLGRSCQ